MLPSPGVVAGGVVVGVDIYPAMRAPRAGCDSVKEGSAPSRWTWIIKVIYRIHKILVVAQWTGDCPIL